MQRPYLYYISESLVLAKRTLHSTYARTSTTPVMEQIEGLMDTVASSSVHVNTLGEGAGSNLTSRDSYVYFSGIYHDGTNLSKITQTASKVF